MPSNTTARRAAGRRLSGCLLAAGLVLSLDLRLARAAFIDPLDIGAVQVPNPDRVPLEAVAEAGGRLVAVGPRGVALVSADGHAWTQSETPVQSDLVAVGFADARNGWACGHDGVILHTTDGGRNWIKQLDGWGARREFAAYYAAHPATDGPAAAAKQEIEINFKNGPSLPWLGIWFKSSTQGLAVGPFGDIASTSDGGASWQPWLDHIDNPGFLDLNAIASIDDHVWIVGEQGTAYLLDPGSQHFEPRPTGYAGSLFGIIGNAKALVVFGLRGTVFRSEDQGLHWTQLAARTDEAIMSGTVTPDGRFILTVADGAMLLSDDNGASFHRSNRVPDMALAGVVSQPGGLVLVGLGGVRQASTN